MSKELKALMLKFDYDPLVGLVWKQDVKGPYGRKGELVGGKSKGGTIFLFGKRILISHIVWYIHNRYWPSDRKEWIDHKDGNRLNNKIENLRSASASQNNSNRKSIGRYSKGVSVNSNGSIRANIQFEGKRYFLGTFETEAEAAAAYQGASRVLHGEFSVFNRQDACSSD